jgi:hypothetical protein
LYVDETELLPKVSGVVVVMLVTAGAFAVLPVPSTNSVTTVPCRRAAILCHCPSVTLAVTVTAAPVPAVSSYISKLTPPATDRMPQKLHADPHERLPSSSLLVVAVVERT